MFRLIIVSSRSLLTPPCFSDARHWRGSLSYPSHGSAFYRAHRQLHSTTTYNPRTRLRPSLLPLPSSGTIARDFSFHLGVGARIGLACFGGCFPNPTSCLHVLIKPIPSLQSFLRKLSVRHKLPVRAVVAVCVLAAPCMLLLCVNVSILSTIFLEGAGVAVMFSYSAPVSPSTLPAHPLIESAHPRLIATGRYLPLLSS